MKIHDLNAIASFVAVSRHQGFRAAAKALDIPSSTVSTRVSRLEQDLGVKLIDRTTRQVVLTEAGVIYLREVEPALENLGQASMKVNGLSDAPAGELRASVPVELGTVYGAKIISEYQSRCPDVEIRLDLNNRRINLLDEGFDVVVRAGRLDDAMLICKAVGHRQSMVTCASKQYLKAKTGIKDIADLAEHSCYTMSSASEPNRWKYRKSGRQKVVTIKSKGQVNSYIVLKLLAMQAMGIVRLPRFLVDHELASKALIALFPEYSLSGLAFHALYPESGKASRKIQEFVSVVDHVLRQPTQK